MGRKVGSACEEFKDNGVILSYVSKSSDASSPGLCHYMVVVVIFRSNAICGVDKCKSIAVHQRPVDTNYSIVYPALHPLF